MKQVFIEELTGHFNLREPKGRKPSTIFFVVRLDGRQYKFSIGAKCYPKFWNKQMQECYTGVNISELDQSNNLVANQKIIATKTRFFNFKQYLCNNISALEDKAAILKRYLQFDMKKKKEVHDIVQYFTDHVTNSYSSGTARSYYNALKLLNSYIQYRNKMPSFKEMATSDFFNGLIQYLANHYTKDDGTKLLAGYANDSVGKLKSLLRQAVADKYITETDRQNIVYGKLKDKSAKDNEIFLWNDEVVRLFNHKCATPKDELIKDIFLLECTTGQRISDVTKVDENISESYGVHEVTLVTKKTSQKLRFSLVFDMAKRILEKYDYSIPAISTSKAGGDAMMNRRLKEIAKAAGITRKWTQSKHESGKDKPTVTEKEAWQVVKTHTGRHTFICLLKLRGWDNSRIAKYTGQSVEMVEYYANSVRDADYSRYEKMKRTCPEQIVKTIEEVEGRQDETPTPTTKKRTVLEAVFGYEKMMQLADLMKYGINVSGRPLTKECRQTILSIGTLSKAVELCKDKDLSGLKKKALELEHAVMALTRIYYDLEIYKTYQYKLLKLGLINDDNLIPYDCLEQYIEDNLADDMDMFV